MPSLGQVKKGYLRGVKGIVIEPLKADGTKEDTPKRYGIKTPQEIGIEAVIVEGETSELRGGDVVLTQVTDPDIITGATLTMIDARYDAEATEMIAGGDVIEEVIEIAVEAEAVGTGDTSTVEFELDHTPLPDTLVVFLNGTTTTDFTLTDNKISFGSAPGSEVAITANYTYSEDTEIVGWSMPLIADQAERVPFLAEVYVQSFNASGGREGYVMYTFYFCTGYAPKVDHKDKEWSSPEFTIKCAENGGLAKPTYDKKFVDTLPDELK